MTCHPTYVYKFQEIMNSDRLIRGLIHGSWI